MSVYFHHGSWWIDLKVKGKRVFREGGYKNELDAKLAEREKKENLTGTDTDFIKLCEKRLKDLEEKRSKDHFRTNKKLYRELIRRFGTKRIKRDDIEDYLSEVAATSHKLANRHLVHIKALFNFGIKRGWLKNNPAMGIERYPVEHSDKYIPSEEDIKLVLETATCEERLYILVVAHTLGRVRSINKLRWDDIRDNYLILRTRKARNSDEKSIRVEINAVLKTVLEQLKKAKDPESEYVFINPVTGKPYGYRRRLLHTLCRWAGVKFFPYHALRHYGASKLDDAGVPLTAIQNALGHERATTTDLYLQSLRGSTKKAMEKLEDLR
ncbi:MAG: tyrosine-type recombinase/integrase [Syntrophobacteraceae bacterium]